MLEFGNFVEEHLELVWDEIEALENVLQKGVRAIVGINLEKCWTQCLPLWHSTDDSFGVY